MPNTAACSTRSAVGRTARARRGHAAEADHRRGGDQFAIPTRSRRRELVERVHAAHERAALVLSPHFVPPPIMPVPPVPPLWCIPLP